MLPETNSMKTATSEVNGTAIKSEPAEIKEEVKEETQGQNNGTASSGNNSGPPSNKIPNGENDTTSQTPALESTNTTPAPPPQPVKKEPAQTLADVLNEECDSPISKPLPPPGRSPGNPQSASMKTSHHSPQEGPSSVPPQPPTTTSRAPSRPHSQPTTGAAGESHFMQQQSQIFVFSTQMANEAADNVMAGQYKNILSYHMDQPATKKFLQKHPLKIGPLNGPGSGLPTRNVRPRHMGMMKGQGFPPNSSTSVAQWVQQQNAHLQEQGYNFPQGIPPHGGNPMMMGGAAGQMRGPMMQDGFDLEMMGMGSHNPNMLSHQKVPNENLTPEQLKRREESLTNLRKIQQMLFPEQRGGQMPYGQGPGPGPDPGMMPEAMRGQMMPGQEMMSPPHGMMTSQQEMMRSQHEMMQSQNMVPSEGMMGSPNSMMGMSQFGGPPGMAMGPHGPRGPGSHMQNLNPAQREWFRLQQEFYLEKRRHHQQQIAQRMGAPNIDMAGGANGPPPSYYSSIAQKHGSVGINSSTSPNSNGPLGSPLVSQGYDPHDMEMFPQGQRRPSLSSLEQASMGPMNSAMPPGAGFDPMMQKMPPGGMMPGMGSPIHGRKTSQTQFHRAGNPEPFLPDMPSNQPAAAGSVKKPPPSYAQSQKRRRSEIEEDLFKNLQPAPSPQQINYNNHFDEELTITKHLNSAYCDPNASSDVQSHTNQFPPNHVPHSPMHVPTSKGPMSNSSQTSSVGPLSSPGPMSVPGPSPMSGATMRLSHYDPPPPNSNIVSNNMNPNNTVVTSSAPHTPTSKSSMSNITSSSLADLAKGVEHLSNQMQQNMMQGGPFHSIQMQGQQGQGATCSGSVSQSNNSVVCTKTSDISSQTQTTPSVNNTYVNATMSIQQLNIQSVNAPGGPQNYNPSMQIQQMNMDQNNMPSGPAPHGPTAQGPMTTASMSQAQGGVMAGGANPSTSMNKTQFSQHQQQVSSQMGGNTMMAQQQHQQVSQQQQQAPQPGRPSSPGFAANAASAMGNANVQIQAKAPNTIQYLPAHPPPNQPNNGPPKRLELDFMDRFAPPMGNMEAKVPTSKMQYFPEQNMRGRMSPFSNQPGGPMGPGPMSQQMMQGSGRSGPDMMPHGMGPGGGPGGPSGPMMAMNEMMNAESVGGPMGNMHPAMMQGGPPDNMMPGNMRMSPGVMGMEGMPPGGGMGGMPHQGSPPFNIGRDPVMGGGMMQGGPMGSRGQMSDMMPGGPGGRMMGNFGPRGAGPMNPGMRMPGPGSASMPGMSSNGMSGAMPGGPSFNPGYQQFQQQLYSQGRPRQISPMDSMMGGPGPGQYMGMMSNMPGP